MGFSDNNEEPIDNKLFYVCSLCLHEAEVVSTLAE